MQRRKLRLLALNIFAYLGGSYEDGLPFCFAAGSTRWCPIIFDFNRYHNSFCQAAIHCPGMDNQIFPAPALVQPLCYA